MTGFDRIRARLVRITSPKALVFRAFAYPACCISLWMSPHIALGVELERRIPDEYETVGGSGGALNNTGYAASDPHAAVRANPALLPFQRGYSVSGGYHWPVAGREYFQASIVDAKTSNIAAGLSYTGFTEDYRYEEEIPIGQAREEARSDSPIIRRGVIGIGSIFGKFALGVGGTYVDANPVRASEGEVFTDRVKGFGLNFGAATALTERLRFGAAVENATNRRIADYLPTTYKGGVAYALSPALTASLDYRQRDRVLAFEGDQVRLDRASLGEDKLMENPEKMAFASLTAFVDTYLRLMASYGQALDSVDPRRAAAVGATIVGKNFSLSYTASRPYMNQSSTAHQAIGLSVEMAM